MSSLPVRRTEEKRQHPRVAFVREVQCQAAIGAFERRFADISAGGMFIDGLNPLPPSSSLTVRFSLANMERPIVASAAVRYAQERIGMGVHFLDLDPEDERRIMDLVERVATVGRPPREEFLRRSSRVMVRIPVRVSGTDDEGATFEDDAFLSRLSKNGGCVVTKRCVQVGTPLQLYTQSGSRFEASVVWVGTETRPAEAQVGLQCRGLAQSLGFYFP